MLTESEKEALALAVGRCALNELLLRQAHEYPGATLRALLGDDHRSSDEATERFVEVIEQLWKGGVGRFFSQRIDVGRWGPI